MWLWKKGGGWMRLTVPTRPGPLRRRHGLEICARARRANVSKAHRDDAGSGCLNDVLTCIAPSAVLRTLPGI